MTKKTIALLSALALGVALIGCQKEQATVKEAETKVEKAMGGNETQPAAEAAPSAQPAQPAQPEATAPATPAQPAQ